MHRGVRLDHRIEQQLALIEIEPLAPQQIAEGVVGGGELVELSVRGAGDADAEVMIAQAHDTIAHRVQHPHPGARQVPRSPHSERCGHRRPASTAAAPESQRPARAVAAAATSALTASAAATRPASDQRRITAAARAGGDLLFRPSLSMRR